MFLPATQLATILKMPGDVTRSDARPPGVRTVAGSILVRQQSFEEIGHEIIYTAIRSRLLIQEGQLSVTGGWMCT